MPRSPRKHVVSGLIRRRFCLSLACAALLLSSAACASAANSQKSSSNDSIITHDEIENSRQPTLFDVVRALRPNWLRAAPTAVRSDQDTGIIVYLDAQRAGAIDVLRQLPSSAAESLRYFSASEAQSRFGLGNLNGVIQIVSAHGSR
jgi:hypothetical protein